MAFFPAGQTDSRVDDMFYTNGTYSVTYNGINKANSGSDAVSVFIPLYKRIPSGKTVTINNVTINEVNRYDNASPSGAITGSAQFVTSFPDKIKVTATATGITRSALYYVGATINFTIS